MIPVRIGALLTQQHTVVQDQVEQALHAQIMAGGRLGTNLVELGFATVADIGRALAQQHGVPVAEPEAFLAADLGLLGRVSPDLCKRYRVFPLALEGDRLHLAMMDPRDQRIMERLSKQTGLLIRPYAAPELRLLHFLEKRLAIPRDARFLRVQLGEEIAGERRRHLKPTVGSAARQDSASRDEHAASDAEFALPPLSSAGPPGPQAPTPGALRPRSPAPVPSSSLEQELEAFFTDSQPPIKRFPSFELDITVEEPEESAGAEPEMACSDPQLTPAAPAVIGLEAIGAALEQALDRGQVTHYAVQKVYAELSLSVLFLVRGEMAVALSACGSQLADEQVQGLVLSISSSALLQRALDSSTLAIAAASEDPVQQQIAEHMQAAPPGQACVVPIFIRSRSVNLLCVQTAQGSVFPASASSDFAVLGERIGAAYLRLIQSAKGSPK